MEKSYYEVGYRERMAENPSDSAFEVTAVGQDQALDESVDRAPWHSPDVVRSFLAYFLVILGVAIVIESLYEYSAMGTTPSALLVTPAVGFVTAVLGYYFGNAGVTKAESAAESSRREAAARTLLIANALPDVKDVFDRERTISRVLDEAKAKDPELYDRIVKFARTVVVG